MSITTFKRILLGAVFALFTLVGTVTPYARGAATLLGYREPEGAEVPSVVVRAQRDLAATDGLGYALRLESGAAHGDVGDDTGLAALNFNVEAKLSLDRYNAVQLARQRTLGDAERDVAAAVSSHTNAEENLCHAYLGEVCAYLELVGGSWSLRL